jgi:hypothetical protein
VESGISINHFLLTDSTRNTESAITRMLRHSGVHNDRQLEPPDHQRFRQVLARPAFGRLPCWCSGPSVTGSVRRKRVPSVSSGCDHPRRRNPLRTGEDRELRPGKTKGPRSWKLRGPLESPRDRRQECFERLPYAIPTSCVSRTSVSVNAPVLPSTWRVRCNLHRQEAGG